MKNIRSFLGAAGVAAVAALGMSTAALAADDDGANKFGYSITISGTSDYIFRGVSYTNSDPAFQPFIEFTYGNPNLTWYLDFWGSNIADPFGPFELDVYAGVRPVFGPLAFDLGILYYTYPNNSISPGNPLSLGRNDNGDYIELKLAGTYTTPIPNLSVGATGYFTPDQGNNWGQTATIEGNAAYTLPTVYSFTPVISGVVGYTRGEDGFSPILGGKTTISSLHDYVYWNAGVKLSVDKYFMDFRYWDTNIDKADDVAGGGTFSNVDSRFVFTAGVNLP